MDDKLKIYVASSWRNLWQPQVVKELRAAGFEVFDYKHSVEGEEGFIFTDVDRRWKDWGCDEWIDHALNTTMVIDGFKVDYEALIGCDVLVMVTPCGASANLEMGVVHGKGKPVLILYDDLKPKEPELMHLIADYMATTVAAVRLWLWEYEERLREGRDFYYES